MTTRLSVDLHGDALMASASIVPTRSLTPFRRCLVPLVLVTLACWHSSARAADSLFYAPPPPSDDSVPFSGAIELGYTALSGNTNTTTLLGKGRITWYDQAWTHTTRAEVKNVSDQENTTAEQYLVSQRERYSLGDSPNYLFGLARYEKERFSGYNNQFTTIIGYGRQLFDNDLQALSLEAGPGYRFDDYENGGRRHMLLGYLAADYALTLSDTASFIQQFSVEGADDNVTIRSYSAISVAINSSLSLRVSHDIKSNSNPPREADAHTDRTTAASVVYNF
ncbi:putative salt-induced outer membrane protein [Kushneria avicenniae]|uniref:Putative salt-induced outer membrane protein n=1 Tax=Kushneria avicenniae TaxID=402385 RepID=A0A1I1I0A0_9GAMM|nr:putative salt-induced outer membrane protein [Kushneria avicenniae]